MNGLIDSKHFTAELFGKVKTNAVYSMGILMCSCEAEIQLGRGHIRSSCLHSCSSVALTLWAHHAVYACACVCLSLSFYLSHPFQPVPALWKHTSGLEDWWGEPSGNSWELAASFSGDSCGPRCHMYAQTHTHTHTLTQHPLTFLSLPLSSPIAAATPVPPSLSLCPWLSLPLFPKLLLLCGSRTSFHRDGN